ncbi:MAG: cation diffusion facilitator family transporter [Candidatus Heimdallarchaeota archaeon]|nr:cation diffusion facilitator family transporter [Candidatus Heimdallarchaeota archaeon]
MADSLKMALIVNISIAIIKFVLGAFSGSAAMISEGYHSLADAINQVLLWFGKFSGKKKADKRYQFGYSKYEFFWAFVVAILIFGISGTIAFIEGLEIIRHPEHHELHLDKVIWNIIALLAAIILESIAFRTAFMEANEFKKETDQPNIFKALDEKQDPILNSVLAEDFLALVGLVVAFIGVGLTYILQDPIIDGYTSLVIGIILGAGGLLLAYENRSYLIGKAVSQTTEYAIKVRLDSYIEIEEIKSFRSMMLGANDMILALDIKFKDKYENNQLAEIIDRIESELCEEFPILKPKKIFIEIQ